MGRFLPSLLGRPDNLLTVPVSGERLPGSRPGFTAGDPRGWIPATLARVEESAGPCMPWTRECDLMLAPYPRPGRETGLLLEVLAELPASYPVALYERDVPVLPNLLVESPEEPAAGARTDPAAAGLHAYRSALRGRGRGGAEALVLLPARRMAALMRGSFLAEVHPESGGSLQNRRFLTLALDHQRTLMVTTPADPPATGLEPVRRVLAVVPHFDDELLLAGEALRAARAGGAEVRVVWLTDGSRGIAGAAPEEAARVRQEEARAALGRIGIEDLHFLGAPETRLRRRGPWTRALRRQLAEFQPERVHAVWWADNHVDHYEANRVLRAAWPRQLQDAEIAAGGFWTPILPNRLLALDADARAAKDYAFAAYASQLAAVDYRRVERGLARWYGRDLPGGGEAEAFLCQPAAEYWRRFAASGAGRRIFVRRPR